MADYRRPHDEMTRRHEREWSDRAGAEDRYTRYESSDRGSRWEGASDDRAFGTYRTDDRDFHDRHRHDSSGSAADEYQRWTAHNPEDWGVQHFSREGRATAWGPRERGGYWRQYESARPHYSGRGPKNYKRPDDRIRDEICDCMTDDAALDASEIEVEVIDGVVTLSGSVMSREQKRRAEDLAERISGVRDVTNQLRVARTGNGHDGTDDSSRADGTRSTSSQPVTRP
jgi:osmotically-inducible protein OsmY